jgi:hypothetical protein
MEKKEGNGIRVAGWLMNEMEWDWVLVASIDCDRSRIVVVLPIETSFNR